MQLGLPRGSAREHFFPSLLLLSVVVTVKSSHIKTRCPTHSSLLLISSSWDFASRHFFFPMLSCQMFPTAQDSPCTKCPAARLVPQGCVFQLLPVNFHTCAKKTLIKLSVLAFVIRRKVIISGLHTLAHAHHLFLGN